MAPPKPLTCAIALVAGLAFGACSSDDSDEASDLDEYCADMADYSNATINADQSTVESLMTSLETSTQSARAAADVAPDEIKADSTLLADAGEKLVVDLRVLDPQSVEEFQDAGSELAQSLVVELEGLEAATNAALTYAQENCNA